jgi:hypothetical protein
MARPLLSEASIRRQKAVGDAPEFPEENPLVQIVYEAN